MRGTTLAGIMSHKKIRGSMPIGISGGMIPYYLLGLTVNGFYTRLQIISMISPFEAFRELFNEGFDFSAYAAVKI